MMHGSLENEPFVAVDFTGMKEYAASTSKNELNLMPYYYIVVKLWAVGVEPTSSAFTVIFQDYYRGSFFKSTGSLHAFLD